MTFDIEELAQFIVNYWDDVKDDVLKLSVEDQHKLITPVCKLYTDSFPPNESYAKNIAKFVRGFQPNASLVDEVFRATKSIPPKDPTMIVGCELVSAWVLLASKTLNHATTAHRYLAHDLVEIFSLTKLLEKNEKNEI